MDDLQVVTVRGEVDLYTDPHLKDALSQLRVASGRGAVVDLRDVTFLDSHALGVLVQAYKQYRSAGRVFLLVSERGSLLRTFALMGLDQVMPLHPSVAQAVASAP